MIPLNDEQLRAIRSGSPTLVNASAGSGKTRCLVAKALSLLESGAKPESVCCITFTNKAATEMKDRLKKLAGNIEGMQISTIHSMCVRILKKFPTYVRENDGGLKVPFSIYDDGDQLSVIKTVLKARNLMDNPNEILFTISRAKSERREDELSGYISEVYKQYQEILKANNACDFDDLQTYALNCLGHNDCLDHFRGLWKHILVDEVQDTSQLQFDIITTLYDPGATKTLFAVGDRNQSVYGWRQAHPENMDRLIEKYKATECYLTYNYRSSPAVISHANRFLQFGKEMVAKSDNKGLVSLTRFQSTEEEAERIADTIQKMQSFEEIAILYRVNARSLLFERALTSRRIPYKVVGDIPFYRRRVVKDLLAALRAANNPEDIESLSRIINNPRRGFGAAKVEKMLLQGRSYVEETAADMPAIEDFLNLLDEIKGWKPDRALNEYLNRTNYIASLTKDTERYMVQALQDVVSGYKSVDELLLAATFLEEDYGHGVKLMTAHASKGLEFDRVFVVGLERGVWPHKNSEDVEEEERLFYVACTRARRYLNISYSRSRIYRGDPMETFASQLFKNAYRHLYGKELQE